MKELKIGLKTTVENTVTDASTAKSVGSGGLDVYATPSMIALMENAAWSLAEECMEDGMTTVGTLMNVKHLSASPIGASIRAEAELMEIDGRCLVYKVTAYDDKGPIGEGTHERFIVGAEKFMSKTAQKLN